MHVYLVLRYLTYPMLARSISLLQLPTELLHDIARHCSKTELASCCRVSKLSNAFSLPYLYGYAVYTMIINKYTCGIITIEITSLRRFLGEHQDAEMNVRVKGQVTSKSLTRVAIKRNQKSQKKGERQEADKV